jgi:hypothetical protein
MNASEFVVASGPPPELYNSLHRARLRHRRQLLAQGRLILLQRKMALPKSKPKPPPELEQEPWSQEEADAVIRQVDRVFGLDKPMPPPNGTWPPRTVYPPDYFYPDGTPRAVPFRRDPKPPSPDHDL